MAPWSLLLSLIEMKIYALNSGFLLHMVVFLLLLFFYLQSEHDTLLGSAQY